MFSTNIIEVAVGVVLVFSLTAILVTQINTIIVTFFNMRPKELKRGLTELITDELIQAKLLAHPFINIVDTKVPADAQITEAQAREISSLKTTTTAFVAPKTFSEAMVGVLIAQSNNSLFEPLRQVIHDMPNSLEKSQLRELVRGLRLEFSEDALRRIYKIIDTISDEKHQMALIAALNTAEEGLEQLTINSADLISLMDGINKISDRRLKSALETLLVSARNLKDAEYKLQRWFEDSIERVQLAFQRRMQYLSIIVAAALAIILNIDALFIARTLWEDPELRRNVAEVASELDQERILQQIAKNEVRAQAAAAPTYEDLQGQLESAQDTVQNILDLQVPIGWEFITVTDNVVNNSIALGLPNPRSNPRNLWSLVPGNYSDWLGLWIQKIIGWVATIIAASQGAPFWFDLLNRIAARRP